MTMKKIIKNLIIGLVLLAIIMNAASAASVVEITKGSDSTSLCPRETGLFTDVLKNTDSKPHDITITTKGSASGWATSVPNGFLLMPGESKTVYTYVTPVQDSVPATYDLAATVSTGGNNQDISHKVIVKKCYGSTLAGNEIVKRACPRDIAKYEMALTNNGQYKETFFIEADGQIKSSVTLSDKAVSLEAGESKKIYAYVNSPAQDGSYSFNVKSQGQIGKGIESFNAVLNVDPCYNYAVNVAGNNSYSMCERTLSSIPMQFENKGTVPNTYSIAVDGPQWAKVDKNEFELAAGEKEYVTLVVAPTYGVNGDFKTKLTITPQKGDLKANSEFSFNVRKCNSVRASFVQSNMTVCNGLSNGFDAIITNDGEISKQYAVDFDAPVWVSSDLAKTHLVTLNPGQQQKITFTASPGEDVNASLYTVNLKTIATDDSKATVFANAQGYISTVLPRTCYNPSISSQFENVTVYYDSAVTLPLIIKNEGLSKVSYSLVMSGTASNFVKLAPASLAVDSGKSETTYLYIAPTPQMAIGLYDAIISVKIADGSFLVTRKIPITVTKDKALATSLASLAPNTLPLVTLQEEPKPTLWARFKAWMYRSFVNQPEQTTDDPNLSAELEQTSQEVKALENTSQTSANENTPAEPAKQSAFSVRVNSLVEKLNVYKYYILAGVIVLLLIILLVRVNGFSKAKKFFEEE